jgi:hypothetical protein
MIEDLQKPTKITMENGFKKISIEIERTDHSLDSLMEDLIIPLLKAMGYNTEYLEEE